MDRKQRVIANVKYQSSKGKGAGKLKGILRYIQYRDDKDGHIPQERGLERWGDHGLGATFRPSHLTAKPSNPSMCKPSPWSLIPTLI